MAGSLHMKGPGTHTAPAEHLHAQLVEAQGKVIKDLMTSAPRIRHDRHRARESATYTLRMANFPPQEGRLRIILHQYASSKCASQ